jgi:prolyl-tRNA synthetase
VIKGEKTAAERFPGALNTYSIEGMMQDRKALQCGTSHFLGQNFAKAFEIKFLGATGSEEYAWTTSWGVSTRLIGALIMAHSDDDGLVLPPKLAPAHVVILPVIHKDGLRGQVMEYCQELAGELRAVPYHNGHVAVELDTREGRGGEKVWNWVKKGVPLRLEIGPRDIASDSVFVGRRDGAPKDRQSMPRAEFVANIASILDEIQQRLLERGRALRAQHTRRIDSKDEFYEFFTPQNRAKPEIHGGFAECHFSGDPEVEEQVNNDLGVTVRGIPLDAEPEDGRCIISGKPSKRRVVFAKAY